MWTLGRADNPFDFDGGEVTVVWGDPVMEEFYRLPPACDVDQRARVYARFAATTDDDGLADMLLSQDFYAIAAAIPHLTDPSMLEFAATRNGVAHWPRLLSNPHTPAHILARMGERDDLYHRYGAGLLAHPNTPETTKKRVLQGTKSPTMWQRTVSSFS